MSIPVKCYIFHTNQHSTFITCCMCKGLYTDEMNISQHDSGAQHVKNLKRRTRTYAEGGIDIFEATNLLRTLKQSKLEYDEPEIHFTITGNMARQYLSNGRLLELIGTCPRYINDIFVLLEDAISTLFGVNIRDQPCLSYSVVDSHFPSGRNVATNLAVDKLYFIKAWGQLIVPYHDDLYFMMQLLNLPNLNPALRPEGIALFLNFLRVHPSISFWEAQLVRLWQFGFAIDGVIHYLTNRFRDGVLDMEALRSGSLGTIRDQALNQGSNQNPWAKTKVVEIYQSCSPPKDFNDLLHALDIHLKLNYTKFVVRRQGLLTPDHYTFWADEAKARTSFPVSVPVTANLLRVIAFSKNPKWDDKSRILVRSERHRADIVKDIRSAVEDSRVHTNCLGQLADRLEAPVILDEPMDVQVPECSVDSAMEVMSHIAEHDSSEFDAALGSLDAMLAMEASHAEAMEIVTPFDPYVGYDQYITDYQSE